MHKEDKKRASNAEPCNEVATTTSSSKNSNDYFKCKSLKHSYPLGASLHYPVLMDWDFLS
jgi:hypothetical protein